MINNYRSRSFSFKQFKQSKLGSASQPISSPTFMPSRNRHCSQPIDNKTAYLGITYASPTQYYTNNNKNQKLIHLQYRMNQSHNEMSSSLQTPINKRFQQNIFLKAAAESRGELSELQNTNLSSQKDYKQGCLYKFFANMWKNENKEADFNRKTLQSKQTQEISRPKKSKSILLIRKINKKKDEIAMKTKQEMQSQFRNKKQIPIHHTQFHFNKKSKCKTEQSPLGREIKREQFTHKIKRAVEEILKLRASLGDFNENCQPLENSSSLQKLKKYNNIMIIEGGSFNELHKTRENELISKKYGRSTKGKFSKTPKKTLKGSANQQGEIGPWRRRNTNDFQSLF